MKDYFVQGRRGWGRLQERGGKEQEQLLTIAYLAGFPIAVWLRLQEAYLVWSMRA